MTQAAIAGQIHQALDVHRGFAAKIALDGMFGVDSFANVQNFLVGKVLNATAVINTQLIGDLLRLSGTDSVNICQRDNNALVGGEVYPGNTSHLYLLLHRAPKTEALSHSESLKRTRKV